MSEPTVALLRESVRRAVAAASLRAVAEQVGLTHRGLALFIDGSRPRPGTVRKLTTWYLHRPRDANAISPDDAEAALAVLVHGVPPGSVDESIRYLLASVRQMSEHAGVAPPPWIDAVLARRR
jgi:hypothetical protein